MMLKDHSYPIQGIWKAETSWRFWLRLHRGVLPCGPLPSALCHRCPALTAVCRLPLLTAPSFLCLTFPKTLPKIALKNSNSMSVPAVSWDPEWSCHSTLISSILKKRAAGRGKVFNVVPLVSLTHPCKWSHTLSTWAAITEVSEYNKRNALTK